MTCEGWGGLSLKEHIERAAQQAAEAMNKVAELEEVLSKLRDEQEDIRARLGDPDRSENG